MTLRSDGRRVISATMQPELYDRLYAHCKELDTPITVFVRNAIKQALPPAGDAEPALGCNVGGLKRIDA
jgi:predicted DNA-binding protein